MTDVSIVIPTHNRREFLSEAIESVRDQTYDSYECIVVDGGSTDGTSSYLRDLSDDQIVPVIRDQAYGVNDARNVGIEEASGSYIVTLDSDDLLYPHAVEQLVSVISERPASCAGVFAGKEVISQHDRVITRDVPPGRMTEATLDDVRSIGGPSGVLFKRDALVDVGGVDSSLPSRGDLDLYLRLLREYSLFGVDTIVCVRRLHESQLSKNQEQIREGIRAVMAKHRDLLDKNDKRQS